MARKFLILVLLMSISLSGVSAVKADDIGRPWKDHAAPYDFKFNNLIDTHQQMKLRSDGTLHGWIYIQVVEEENPYAPAGVPIARRADCTNPALDCRIGWEVIGIPVKGAMLVQRGPRLWDFNEGALPDDITFTHFHWTMGSNDKNPKKPCGLVLYDEAAPVTYSGYLFQRTAVTTFYWLGGNPEKEKGRLVTPGVDLHSNIYDIWSGGGGDSGEGEDHEEGDCAGHDSGGDAGGTGGAGH